MWHLRRIFYQIGIDLFLFVTRLLGAKPGYQQPKESALSPNGRHPERLRIAQELAATA